jgi:hypothetical protein
MSIAGCLLLRFRILLLAQPFFVSFLVVKMLGVILRKDLNHPFEHLLLTGGETVILRTCVRKYKIKNPENEILLVFEPRSTCFVLSVQQC